MKNVTKEVAYNLLLLVAIVVGLAWTIAVLSSCADHYRPPTAPDTVFVHDTLCVHPHRHPRCP